MKCPGQDRRYWTGEAVFEVPCPQCGSAVEVFRDESTVRCSHCSHRFANPGLDMGCAQWCSFAKECLGFAPERTSAANRGEKAFAAALIQAIEEEFKTDQPRLAHALRVFQYAKELLRGEEGDPRVVLAAALLLETGRRDIMGANASSAKPTLPTHQLQRTRQILDRIGLDPETKHRVCQMIVSFWAGEGSEVVEFNIVCDADTLAKLAAESSPRDPGQLEKMLAKGLKSEAGREKARCLLQVRSTQMTKPQ